MEQKVKILGINQLTHDVKRFVIEKPKNYNFKAGQSTEITIDKPEFIEKKRPFSFTSLPQDPYIEFMIKKYKDHHGITEQLHKLKPGDKLIIREPFGDIKYKGPGIFITMGNGITPLLSILRSLKEEELKGNKLIYANKTQKDIVAEDELKHLLSSKNVIQILSREEKEGYHHGHIDKAFIKENIKNLNQYFYLTGNKMFTKELKKDLIDLGVKEEMVVTG